MGEAVSGPAPNADPSRSVASPITRVLANEHALRANRAEGTPAVTNIRMVNVGKIWALVDSEQGPFVLVLSGALGDGET